MEAVFISFNIQEQGTNLGLLKHTFDHYFFQSLQKSNNLRNFVSIIPV